MHNTFADGIPNPVFIQEKVLKPNLHPVEFVDDLIPVYKKNNGGIQNKYSLLFTE